MNERFEKRPRFGHNDRQRFAPPVNVDEELDVKIEAVGEKGDGVAKKDGFVLFIPNVKEGDYVRVKVTKVLRKVGFAEVVGEAKAPEPQQQEEKKEEVAQEPQEEEYTPSEEDSEDFGEEAEPQQEEKEPSEEDVDLDDVKEDETQEEPSEEDTDLDDVKEDETQEESSEESEEDKKVSE